MKKLGLVEHMACMGENELKKFSCKNLKDYLEDLVVLLCNNQMYLKERAGRVAQSV
jgi:hypothetical protein